MFDLNFLENFAGILSIPAHLARHLQIWQFLSLVLPPVLRMIFKGNISPSPIETPKIYKTLQNL